jgi:predicted DNA binding CopG/RHH family protein
MKRSEDDMPESKPKDPIPGPNATPEEIGEFWDTHSLADYWDETHEVQVHVNLKRMHDQVRVEHDLIEEISQFATKQGMSTEKLVNLWLREKLSVAASNPSLGSS